MKGRNYVVSSRHLNESCCCPLAKTGFFPSISQPWSIAVFHSCPPTRNTCAGFNTKNRHGDNMTHNFMPNQRENSLSREVDSASAQNTDEWAKTRTDWSLQCHMNGQQAMPRSLTEQRQASKARSFDARWTWSGNNPDDCDFDQKWKILHPLRQ